MTASSLKLTDFVVRISSATPASNQPRFGTGFVIHRDPQYAYIVTCCHVVEDLCPNRDDRNLLVENASAQLICWDQRDGFDLAVLRVDGDRLTTAPLKPKKSDQSGVHFATAGFSRYTTYNAVARLARGVLAEEMGLLSTRFAQQRARAWHVVMHEGELAEGNSGAPVIDADDCVIGVVSTEREQGKQGMVIAIETLIHIWQEMPSGLFAEERLFATVQRQIGTHTKRFLMNFEQEVTFFEQLLTQPALDTRMVAIQGPSGSGKTRLLEEYEIMAHHRDVPTIRFDLAQQITVEECLDRIVDRLDINQFKNYNQVLQSGKPDARSQEENWLRNLTRSFFADLGKPTSILSIIVIFDQFEKGDRSLRSWLLDTFFQRLYQKPLVVVVGGQNGLDDVATTQGARFFRTGGLAPEWCVRAAQAQGIEVDLSLVYKFYELFGGLPFYYDRYLASLQPVKGQPA